MKALALPRLRIVKRRARVNEFWFRPAGWVFIWIAAIVLIYLATAPRTYALLDQDNYLRYFAETSWQWLRIYREKHTEFMFLVGIVTDELGWRLWILLVNWLGALPEDGVRLTVVVLNAITIYTFSKTRRPLLALLLYIAIPTALSTAGLFQIRQGFAFAIAMYSAIVYRRPILGALIASTIHTTFAIPAIFLIVAHIIRKRTMVAIAACSATGIALASAGHFLFERFGGRRLGTYSADTDDFTIKLLFLLAAYGIASALVLYTRRKDKNWSMKRVVSQFSIVHIALIVYLLVAFFIFPFGKGRVWYYVPMLLPYLIPEIVIKRWLVLGMTVILFAMVGADVVNNYYKNVYDYFISDISI
ncbi:hypothetical protein A6V36_35760 [Paraburkholderia ginsengiterrae]|uniref:EpsG family protein n=1 Tax=Paraburkholderia ginsengiterrae TaxID=1462993 RepID=A0A1A9MYR6_9BURK|nr:EpsG family protein [Paraburkholderia ginsengiterrae]OAJ53696.1 hypothetical protein A6V37_35285 [Paraburkholderia ginsengiterrae]OAJ54721.1 hypothetical protein A6V36_35760 [Paraburkholderia ginsengiterrae]